MSQVIFVSGIDTDSGKTYATGFLAKKYLEERKSVITLKFIQTGCKGYSEDIQKHREIMGVEYEEDKKGITSPIIFSYPASAQLAAKLEEKDIDLSLVDESISQLQKKYEIILVEGAGGLMVPITDDYFTIDYVKERNLPLVLVSNGILGSINHTILSLEAIKARNLTLESLIYNSYFDEDKVICNDTKGFLKRYLNKHFPSSNWIEIPAYSIGKGEFIK